jgi:uncharacterized protein YecT (DUF1311 family)
MHLHLHPRATVVVTSFLIMVSAGGASAAEPDCKNPQDQYSMNMCAARDYKISDAKLNGAYRALLAGVSATGRAKLQSAQRAWVAYRDAQCAFETAGTSNGSVHPMVVLRCLDALTQMQTRRLEQQLHCQEGDLSCGNQ